MNPFCKCTEAGWCPRHQMEKNEYQFQICKGLAPTADCGRIIAQCWENGHCGAAAPADAQKNLPPFCDPKERGGTPAPCTTCTGAAPVVKRPTFGKYVSNAAMAAMRFIRDGLQTTSETERTVRKTICGSCPLNDRGTCTACGCILNLKQQSRAESCPAGKWFPALREPRAIVNPIRNLTFHLLPVAANENWKFNIQELRKRWCLFNGRKIIAIAIEKSGRLKTVQADEVIEYCRSLGMEWDASRAVVNDSVLREVITFPWLLSQVESTDPNEVTFCCHGKSVTHDNKSITKKWAERQYRVCLDDWDTVQHALERFSMVGSLRRFGEFKTADNHQWHYSGTFYWLRHDDVFKTNKWQTIDQQFFGTESWPGRMFPPEETACIFGDNVGDMYKQEAWDGLADQINVWEGARR